MYAVPTFPNGSVEFAVIESGVTFSVNCRLAVFAAAAASVAFTRNVYVPDDVGVPLKRPPGESVRPGGRVPPSTDQVIRPRAQHADSEFEYGDPVVVEPRLLLVLMLVCRSAALM